VICPEWVGHHRLFGETRSSLPRLLVKKYRHSQPRDLLRDPLPDKGLADRRAGHREARRADRRKA